MGYPDKVLLTVAALNFVLGIYIFSHDRKNPVNASFASFAAFLSIWPLMLFLFRQTADLFWSTLFMKEAYLSATFIAAFFFKFSLSFPATTRISRRLNVLLTIATLGVATFIHIPGILVHSVSPQSWGKDVTLEPIGYYIFSAYFLFFFFGGLLILFKKYLSMEGGVVKKQLRDTFLSVLIAGTLGTFFNLILPSPLLHNFSYIWIGPIFTFLIVLFIGHAIARYQLMNIEVIATELFVILMALLLFFDTFFLTGSPSVLYRTPTLVMMTLLGALLIRNTRQEVRQRHYVEAAHKELQQLDQTKSEFISITSHQLRTPLTAIIGYLSMISEGDFGAFGERLKTPLDRVFLSSKRLMNLVETLLDISRIEAGRFEIRPEEMNILPMAQRLIEDFQIQAKDKNLKLTLEVQNPIPKIYADPLKIEDVLTNIIDNAMKYTEKGEVTVRIMSQQDSVQCCVEDTGVGLDPAEIPKIFRRFVRGANANKMNTEGLGMGLYVAERVVSAHGGKIWAQSAGKDQGSTFCFTIPINRKHPPLPSSGSVPVKVVEHVDEKKLP